MLEIETGGIPADEGMPRDPAEHMRTKLPDEVNAPDPAEQDEDDNLVPWGLHGERRRVELRVGPLPLDKTGALQLSNHAGDTLTDHGWDRFIYITDLPISTYEKPVFSQVNNRVTRCCSACLPSGRPDYGAVSPASWRRC